jgi:hypothetical protein
MSGVNDYTCDCHVGFTGSKCEANIDECHNKPCVHGNCTNGVNGYTCDCHVGFTGSKCEANIDVCQNKQCVHGICTDRVNGYTCDCHYGFTGSKCETNIDDGHKQTHKTTHFITTLKTKHLPRLSHLKAAITSTLNGQTVTSTQNRPNITKGVGNKWSSSGFSTSNTFQGKEINLFP